MDNAPVVSLSNLRLARFLLTAALTFVFGVFGVWKFLQPLLWIGWIPLWMEGILGFSRETWLSVIGGIEILLAGLLLAPIQTLRKVACVLIALHLIAVLTQTGWNDVFVRDAGLLLASLALLVLLR